MANIVKYLLIFAGGAVIGGGTTYFITNSINEAKKDKEISDRVEALVKEYRARDIAKLNDDIKEQIKDVVVKRNDEGKPIAGRYSIENEKAKEIIDRLEYSNLQTSLIKEPDEAPDDEEKEEVVLEKHNAFDDSEFIDENEITEKAEDEVKQGLNEKPYIISPDEYQNTHEDDYEKESLIFFKDNILTDEDYVEISNKDAEKLLGGPKLFTAFGSKGAKENVVFIRNDLHHTDYEIFHSTRKYTTDVLHMEDEDNEE